jgi:hypothetical protein
MYKNKEALTMGKKMSFACVLVAALWGAGATAADTFLGPSEYLGFGDSPFDGLSFEYFFLEDFESGQWSVPGVGLGGDGQILGPGSLTDSVDEDDGLIDGSGLEGHSLFAHGNVDFTFDEQELGALPTHVGIVWTDGASGRNTFFEAFDAAGLSLGTLGPFTFGDASNAGTTVDDRFLGIIHDGGIAAVVVHYPVSAGIEVDHLQYGRITVNPGPLELALDIKPGACPNGLNVRSEGKLSVALLGTADIDVSRIDATTIQLSRADGEGGSASPLEGPPGPHTVIEDAGTPFDGAPCDCHAMEGDGIPDLSMKFSTPALVDSLELDDLPDGEWVELVVTGSLMDGTAFEARDCVEIKSRKK